MLQRVATYNMMPSPKKQNEVASKSKKSIIWAIQIFWPYCKLFDIIECDFFEKNANDHILKDQSRLKENYIGLSKILVNIELLKKYDLLTPATQSVV